MDRRIRLPKEGFIDEQDVEGHLRVRVTDEQPGPEEGAQDDFRARADGSDDTEGHRMLIARASTDPQAADDDDTEGHIGRPGNPDDMTVLPAPPSLGLRRTPGHGGELTDDGEDVEGHRIIF